MTAERIEFPLHKRRIISLLDLLIQKRCPWTLGNGIEHRIQVWQTTETSPIN
jgi:hypothetical protein